MMFPVVRELAAEGMPVAVACRVLKVSTSGYDDWRERPASPRAVTDAALTETVTAAHAASHGTYGARRVHAELRLGQGVRIGCKRVERLMRAAGLQGVHRRRLRGCTRRDPNAQPAEDLVGRRFTVEAPNRLWCADVTQHRTGEGWFYLAVVLDAYSRRVVGWAMADHLRAELVVDALGDGPVATPARARDHSPRRPRRAVHQLGLRVPAARGRPARLRGLGR